MDTFAFVVGWLCIVFCCFCLMTAAVGACASACRRALERFEWAIAEKTQHALGRTVASSSHWFGESKETALALQILGDRLTGGLAVDPSQWREDWRRRIGAQEE